MGGLLKGDTLLVYSAAGGMGTAATQIGRDAGIVYGVSEIQTGERASLPRALSAMARFPFSTMPWWKSAAILNENKGVFGLNLNHWWRAEKDMSRLLQPIGERLARGSIKPVVAKSFPFSQAADAHRYLQERRNVGKVVLTPD